MDITKSKIDLMEADDTQISLLCDLIYRYKYLNEPIKNHAVLRNLMREHDCKNLEEIERVI